MANEHRYQEQCSVPSDCRNVVRTEQATQNVYPFDTTENFWNPEEPGTPDTFTRATKNTGDSAVMVLIGLAEEHKVPEWLLEKYISFHSLG